MSYDADVDAPLSPQALDRFRLDLEAVTGTGAGTLGLAVSGGPDSVALLLLAQAARPGRVEAATVDHGLRAESGGEAEFVADLCAGLGVPHVILHAEVDRARASLQRSAREARYRALAAWAGERSIRCLATGHHADDQAETLIMRLIRGSGVGGLAGMRPSAPMPVPSETRLIRPLLGWRRRELADLVATAGIVPVVDPSNVDENFDRARVRARLAGAEWIDAEAIARSAAALSEADDALAWYAEVARRERITRHGLQVRLTPAELPPEIVRRLLEGLLAEFAAAPAPRGEEIGRLAATLALGGTATLAGVKCVGGEQWTFEAAPPRRQRG